MRNFLKRWSYRAGFRYGTHNQTYNGDKLGQYAVTLGVGVPVKFLAISSIDVGVEYGRRGYNLAERLGLVRQLSLIHISRSENSSMARRRRRASDDSSSSGGESR